MKVVFSLSGVLLCILSMAQSNVWNTPEGRERIFEATIQLFSERYWKQDYIDWENWGSQFRTEALEAISREGFDLVMQRMVSSLNDQHSKWLGQIENSPVVLERSLGIEHSHLPGTGLVIEKVLPQSPAQNVLYRGDVIIRVNTYDLRNRTSYDVAQLMSEALSQTEVWLNVKRKQQRLNIRLNPEELNLSELKNLPQSEMLSPTLGYIYLPTFTQQDTAYHFHQHLKALQTQGATRLVLDLRDNPGGGLGELGLVMCAFIRGSWIQAIQHNQLSWTASCEYHHQQVINTLRDDNGVLSQDSLEEATFFEGPVVVLVSHNNNSAGEVAALVLNTIPSTTIIGEKTVGNVEALQEFTLSDQSVVLIAVANLQGVQGENFSLGVTPNIESQTHLSELARGFDAPLAEATKLIAALPFTPGKYF